MSGLLDELAAQLKDGSYRPSPTRRVMIPKPGRGELRPLSLSTVRDRIVQTAVKIVLEPVFEADFLSCSFGCRPRRSVHDALQQFESQWLSVPYHWIIFALIGGWTRRGSTGTSDLT